MRLSGSLQLNRLLIRVKGCPKRNFCNRTTLRQGDLILGSTRVTSLSIPIRLSDLLQNSHRYSITRISARYASLDASKSSMSSSSTSSSTVSSSQSSQSPSTLPSTEPSSGLVQEQRLAGNNHDDGSLNQATSANISQDQAPTPVTPDTLDLQDFIVPDPPPPPELLPPAPISPASFDISMFLPTGWICTMLLFFENYMPYYVAIVACTAVGRLILTPVLLFSQRQSAKMALVNPKLSELMKQKRDAELREDREKLFKLNFRIAEIYKSTDAFKFKNMAIPPSCTLAVFGSFFMVMRKMCNFGHEPMQTGGIGPFFDLTVPDPSYILPTWTAVTLFAVMKLGMDFGAGHSLSPTPSQEIMKKAAMVIAPFAIFWFVSSMPAGLGLYWATNNTVSILQSLVLLQPGVRKFFKIPPIPPKPKKEKKGIKQSLIDGFKSIKNSVSSMWDNRRIGKMIDDSRTQFDRSGIGPLRKTFDYDPTRVNPKVKKN